MASLNVIPEIHLEKEAQIGLLLTKRVKILDKYLDFAKVFSEKKTLVLPECNKVNKYTIDLKDNKQPLYGPIYSLGPVKPEFLKIYIKTHLKTSFIQPSKSPTGTSILFNKKRDGTICLYINYGGLSNLTNKNRYPLPLIGESLKWLSWAKRFTGLDLSNAYYQMRIKEDDNWKMAFQIKYNHFKYQMILFRLSNALAIFQDYINRILIEKFNIFVVIHLDEILIYTKDPGQEHVETVLWVLNILRKNGLFANLKKCWFYKDKMQFLRYIISS